MKSFVTLNPRGGGRDSVLRALPGDGAELKQKIKTELRILENESKLPRREAAGTIHINTGHGSNVVIGNGQTVFSQPCGVAVTMNSIRHC